jgi:hypothetical protein
VTIQTTDKYEHSVVILQYPSGIVEKEFPNPENHFYAMPRWSDDGQKIVVLRLTRDGKTVSLIDATSGAIFDLMPVSHENIGHPLVSGKHLLFNSPVSGIDNIYLLDLETNERYQITSAKYGAYNGVFSADKKFIYYNNQGRNGMDVVRIPFDVEKLTEYRSESPTTNLYDHLVEQEGDPLLFKNIPKGNYPIKRFSRWAHLINPFSWGLLVQNDLSRFDMAITSQDILSTTSISAGYTYDLAEETGGWRAGVSYQGLYPIIDLDFQQSNRSVEEEFATRIIDGETDVTGGYCSLQMA